MASLKIKLKLLVDKTTEKVVFAEADKDFIDFLIHLLSLPIATAVRLLKERTMDVGSLSHFYESLQNLPESYLQPNQKKNSLLNPRVPILSAAAAASGISLTLTSNDHDFDTRKAYTCASCMSHMAVVPNLNCPNCERRSMDRELSYVNPPRKGGGFLKGLVSYIVMDNLEFMPMSTKMFVSLLKKFDIEDVSALEETEVELGVEEGLKLLKLSLECKSVLTSFYHDMRGKSLQSGISSQTPPNPNSIHSFSVSLFLTSHNSRLRFSYLSFLKNLKNRDKDCLSPSTNSCILYIYNLTKRSPPIHPHPEISSHCKLMASPKIKLKLLVDKTTEKVVFAEADKDFIDFLIHLLSLPVATAVRLLKERTMDVGSLSHFYESLQNLPESYLQPNQKKNSLLNPRVPILSAAAAASGISLTLTSNDHDFDTRKVYTCASCMSHMAVVPNMNCPNCERRSMDRELSYVNPPWKGGGFLKGLVSYIVMDNLEFMPMSTKMFVSLLKKFDIEDVSALEETEVELCVEEGLKLLKLSLECKSVLTSFYHDMREHLKSFCYGHCHHLKETNTASLHLPTLQPAQSIDYPPAEPCRESTPSRCRCLGCLR
ncbi:hypothetical protein Ddye_001684 [Dipteronia dyeriana]|uniref:Uncharacterized protein n=1 Tax=Dipteronia dyeriana TaxID=168575 RepID=A0AAD9XPQ5_9ROSI|nr:hypothetical protein Ddye_001684 [Dipteronia dyeriana]